MSDYVANVNQKVTYCINSDIAICLAIGNKELEYLRSTMKTLE